MVSQSVSEYITLAVIACVFIALASIIYVVIIQKRQKKFNKDFENLDLPNCPKTAQYMSDFQQEAIPWAFGFEGAVIAGVFILGILVAIKYGKLIDMSFTWLIILFLMISIIIFITIYKVQHCYLARMCGMGSCVDPYFNNQSSQSSKPSKPSMLKRLFKKNQ